MTNPTDTLPSRFGLSWGIPREQCEALFAGRTARVAARFITLRRLNGGNGTEVVLRFSKEGVLTRVEEVLHESRSFWETVNEEEHNEISTRFRELYAAAVADATRELGPPSFSGAFGEPGYPETEVAAHITYWDAPDGRLQLEFDQPDREFPYFVRRATYPSSD